MVLSMLDTISNCISQSRPHSHHQLERDGAAHESNTWIFGIRPNPPPAVFLFFADSYP